MERASPRMIVRRGAGFFLHVSFPENPAERDVAASRQKALRFSLARPLQSSLRPPRSKRKGKINKAGKRHGIA
jgi:hypothetical protein